LGKISVTPPIGPRFLGREIINYLDSVNLIGNQSTAVDFINSVGRLRRQQQGSENQFQEGFIIIGPPGTGKTFVICIGALNFIRISDRRQRRANERLSQIAIGTFTNSAADRIVEQFDDVFIQANSPLSERISLVKRLVSRGREVRPAVGPYSVSTYRGFSISREDWGDTRKDVDHARIFVGTIYQIENALKSPSANSLPRVQPEIILIDEASQLNLSKLNLSFYRANQRLNSLGLIGDPYQLPPINQILELQENIITSLLGGSSMPQRIDRYTILDYQRRMHPVIRRLSETIGQYPIQITDDTITYQRDLGPLRADLSLSGDLEVLFGLDKRVVILDDSKHPRSQEESLGTSRINQFEKSATELIARVFRVCYPELDSRDIIAIVPYSAQETSMQTEDWRVGTVDAFQGQEASLVIASTTRTDSDSPLDFVANRNRLNVMISRARAKLVILNYRTIFEDDPVFSDIYQFISNEPDETAIIDFNQDFERDLRQFLDEMS